MIPRVRRTPSGRALPSIATLTNRTPSARQSNPIDENRRLTQLLESQREEHRREIEKLELELKEKVKRNQQQKLDYEREVQVANDRIAKQQARIDHLSKRSPPPADAQSQQTNQELREAIARLEAAREPAEQRVSELGVELNASQERLKEAKERVKSLPHAHVIESVHREKQKLERHRDTEIGKFESVIAAGSGQLGSLESELEASTRESEELQAENTKLNCEMEGIENSIRSVRQECGEMRAQLEANGPQIPYEHVRLRIGQMEEKRRRILEKRRKELEGKLEATHRQREMLEAELGRRVGIIEELNAKVNSLTHQAANAKSEAEREVQQLKRTHGNEVRLLGERLSGELEAALAEQSARMRSAVAQARPIRAVAPK
jgi:chromosome segregation ATPase